MSFYYIFKNERIGGIQQIIQDLLQRLKTTTGSWYFHFVISRLYCTLGRRPTLIGAVQIQLLEYHHEN
jgi:hypothetical protein